MMSSSLNNRSDGDTGTGGGGSGSSSMSFIHTVVLDSRRSIGFVCNGLFLLKKMEK
jgi:hypothetical protein